MLYRLLRSGLFAMEPERAHKLSLMAMATAGALPGATAALRLAYGSAPDPVQLFGLSFSNRVGVAAGYDKDATAYRGLCGLGFGHVELGTVTPRPQPGNPEPRVFRLPEDRGVINRLGFPSVGAQVVARRLSSPPPRGLIVGVNLGKNKDTPLDEALLDYEPLVGLFAPLCDYLVVNVSSPNTPGLRELQHRDHLEALLAGLIAARDHQAALLGKGVPLLIKISPDLDDGQLEEAVGVTTDAGLDGIIATNTTVERAGLSSPAAAQSGGLSGAPLTARSLQAAERITALTGGRLPLISVGGIMCADDARRRIDAGASLVQVYTGLIYRGPRLCAEICDALSR